MRILINILGLKIGWFACVLGAAGGNPYIGPAIVLAHMILHLSLSPRPAHELRLILFAGLLGASLDTLLASSGAFTFAAAWAGAPYLEPVWMGALWFNFATTLNSSLSWLAGRPLPSVLLGAFGGPLAYAGGGALGALTLAHPWSLPAVAAEWSLALPLLFYLNRRWTANGHP